MSFPDTMQIIRSPLLRGGDLGVGFHVMKQSDFSCHSVQLITASEGVLQWNW